MRGTLLLVPGAVVLFSACGLFGGVDPRCETLCVIQEPSLSGAYDICSQASADRCKQDCDAHIKDVTSTCASCLLEQATFSVPPVSSSGDVCNAGTCTTTGRAGSCDYPQGNDAARDDCIRQVSPRREVECTPTYRPVSECNSTCLTR